MQKSIKKVIAGAVAALMITSSMPFVALAAPGDYAPDVQLQFSTFCQDPADPTSTSGTSATGYQASGLCGFPIQWDQETGTLYAKKADMNTYNLFYDDEADLIEDDWVLEEGDVFAVTVRMDNITEAWGAQVDLKFSDNITPAGLWSTGKGNKTAFGYSSEDSAPKTASNYKELVGFRKPIADWSASELYEGMNDTVMGDPSTIKDDPYAEDGDGWSDLMISAVYLSGGESIDLSSVDAENGFFDITNGTYDEDNGYTYDGKAIMATFAFQITDEGPIQFALHDPTSEHSEVLDGAYLIAKKSDGTTAADKTTYAVNKYNLETMKNDGDVEHAGSAKMTFMGKNENGGEVTPTHVHDYKAVVTAPTCTEKGYTTYTCQNDGCDNPTYVADYTDAIGHAYAVSSIDWGTLDTATGKVTANYVCANNATHTKTEEVQTTFEVTQQQTENQVELTTYTYAEGDFSDSKEVKTKEKAAHVHVPAAAVVENEVPATCKAKGSYDEVVYCSACGEELSRETKDIDKLAHTPGTAVRENEVPATCKAKGSYDEVVYCTECNTELSRETKDIDKLAHTPGTAVRENEVPATCKAKGSYDEVVYCTECNTELSRETKDIDKLAHTPGAAVRENEVAATKKDKGSYDEVVYCTECNAEISRETKYTDALGYTVTLAKTDIGSVDGLSVGENKFAFGETYTATATAVEGATFVGWEINGNIVSKEASLTGTVSSDITITPVFEDEKANTITVTFYDKFGNTIKQYKDMDVADYQAAIAAEFDSITAPTYPSYTFKEWDKTKDEILALEASTTIWATYEKVEETVVPKYTVTTNATLELPDGIVNGEIPYDTKVTVKDADAKAWKIGDTIVAYGSEYSFYVGSDVIIDPVTATVEEKATTTIIGANLVAGSDYKFNIVATRNVPDGFTLSDYGFVYGKDLTDAELNLDFVGQVANSGATIKAVHAGTRNTESNEFAFNYGIKAKNAPVTAKSFIVVTDKDGNTDVIYSDMFTQDYE